MSTPITAVIVFPNYATGFAFRWELMPTFVDPPPYVFVVETGPTPNGPWEAVSPEITNKLSWASTEPLVINKDEVLHFRVTLKTAQGEYASAAVKPYGDLPKREFMIAKELMRKEVLQARSMSGIIGKLWTISNFGPICSHCRDAITGDVLDSNCQYCLGTGREPPYYGPYATWMTFSVANRDEKMAEDGSGTRQPYSFEVRMVCCPYAKEADIVIDTCKNKRYYVDVVTSVAEIRRIPIIQNLVVHEAPVTEPIYRLEG